MSCTLVLPDVCTVTRMSVAIAMTKGEDTEVDSDQFISYRNLTTQVGSASFVDADDTPPNPWVTSGTYGDINRFAVFAKAGYKNNVDPGGVAVVSAVTIRGYGDNPFV